ncbi:response regulator [Verrucomicrobiota bacterium]
MARILIVDDEEGILTILNTVLSAEGYEVVSSLGGEKAQGFLNSDEEFDLMISDIRMDSVNGMDLLKLACDKRPGLPVIMLTAYGQVETAIESLQLGAFDYVKKPFKVDELITTVQKAIASRNYTENE